MNKKLLFTITMLFVNVVLFSQVTTSKIKGTVTDESGEALFGATVSVLHVPTGTLRGTTAQDNGRYTILNLRVGGPYKITFSYLGFKQQVVNDVFLTLGKTTNIDATLVEEGQSLNEIVISSAKNKIFNNDRTGAQTSVTATQLKVLPTISRSASDFTRLEPTASNGSFGGRNDQFNNFSLDGSIFNNPFGLDAATPGGQTNAQPISLDAIEQISVSVAPYDVTQSGFTGASVDAVTKSGTNEFRGTVYGFYRNEDLTGGKINGQDVFKPSLSQNQYGVSIGGPIIKNKLFFFANFEKDEVTELGSSFVPNTGSGALNESRVLESDLQLVSSILSQVNIGNGQTYNPGAYQGFTYDANSTKGLFKLDWNINDNHRLAFVYNFLTASKEKPAHPTALGFRGPNATTLQFENAGYQINNNINSFLVELNSTFNEETSNKLQVGYTHFDDFRSPLSSPAPSITILNGGSNYIIAGHEPFSINNRLDQKVLQITNNMSFFKGDHTYTVGFSFEKFMFDNSFNLGAFGAQGVFFPSGDISDFRNTAGNPTAEAALVANYQAQFDAAILANNTRLANGSGNAGGYALAETNVGQLAFYLQDEWNASDDLKITYGVRFDKPLFFDTTQKAQEVIDNACCFDPTISYYNPNTQQEVTLDNRKMPTDQWLFSPRVGFNWDANGEGKLQLRGGSGIFTGRLPFVWIGNQIANPESFFYQAVDPDFQFPQVWRTNIGVDYKLESNYVISTDLSYSKDINGAHVQNWGLRNPTGTLSGADNRAYYLNSDKGNSGYVFTNSNRGRTYNFTTKIEKTFDNGLYTNIAYSYLDSKDVNSIEAEITGDAFAFNPVVGNANNDVLAYSKYGDTHRIIGVASKKFNFFGEKSPTTFTTFFEYAKGGRFNYTYGGDINNDGSSVNDLLYVPTASELNSMQFTGTGQAAAFESYIQQDEYLNGRRGQYVERYGALAPWRGRWDLKVLQDFNFNVANGKENTIQISLDVLNVGNLINSDWGVVQQPRNVQPLGVSVDANTQVPTYTFDETLTNTFAFDSSLMSRWQAQIGLRYIF
ncbi:TonB-dependent receptor [Polaribacter sp.]|uniref:TonB-dependent receptor n=1 Tax=Polaribacter sp. TaxID=1920175 RepID=UPI003F696CF7